MHASENRCSLQGPATAGSSSCTHPRRIVGASGIDDQGDGSGRWNLSDVRGKGGAPFIFSARSLACRPAVTTATTGDLCPASRPAAPCPRAFAKALAIIKKVTAVGGFWALEKLGSIRAPAFPISWPVTKRGIRGSSILSAHVPEGPPTHATSCQRVKLPSMATLRQTNTPFKPSWYYHGSFLAACLLLPRTCYPGAAAIHGAHLLLLCRVEM